VSDYGLSIIRPSHIFAKLRNPLTLVRERFLECGFATAKQLYKDSQVALEYCEDPVMRSAVTKGLRHNAVAAAAGIVEEQFIEVVLAIAAFLIFTPCTIFLSIEIAGREHMPFAIPKMCMGLIFAQMVATDISKITSRAWRFATTVAVTMTGFVVAALLTGSQRNPWYPGNVWYAIIHPVRIDMNSSSAYAVTAGSVALFIMVIGGTFIAPFVLALLGRSRERKYASTIFIFGLAYTLSSLVERPHRIRDLDFKATLARDIESVAICLQDLIPRFIALPDPAGRSRLEEKCRSAAAALRALEVDIAVSGERALDNINRVIARYIIAAATGNYASLPDAPFPSRTERKIKVLAQASRSLAIALIPLACLVGARCIGLGLSSTFNNWAIAVALIWSVITILSAIDPHYKSRIAEMKDVMSLLRRRTD
jgi:hypothetical protein